MSIPQALKSKDAELCVEIDCHIRWRTPPENTEERMERRQMNSALAQIAFALQEATGHSIMAIVKIKGEQR